MDNDAVMGSSVIQTPFGNKYFINADFTASGIIYKPIERYIGSNILPYYSNVHSNAANGQLMAHYVTQAKEMIRKAVNAKPCDKLIFSGNGCSGAVIHLIHILNLKSTATKKWTVYVTVAEHHSNYLPWTHLNVNLVIVPLKPNGLIDIAFLKRALKGPHEGGIICSFIAGSNVTGVLQPIYALAKLVHQYNGLIFFDFAASAPYVPINLHNELEDPGYYFDAIFISPHKFLGGPATPGLLIAHHKLFKNKEPFCPGGGTVRFVCKKYNHYIDDPERRETGGTPNIIGCIRVGLAFQLKGELLPFIQRRDRAICRMVHPVLTAIPGIYLINPPYEAQIAQFPVYSFTLKGIHYNLVVVLLNDLFGIQTRGGVSCCSVYAEHLFKLCREECDKIYKQIVTNHGVPGDYGWCRVSFHYTMSDAVVQYILAAIEYVAAHGAEYKSRYDYIQDKNIWVYQGYTPVMPPLDYHSLPAPADIRLTGRILKKQFEQAVEARIY